MSKVGVTDMKKVIDMLEPQRKDVLERVKKLIAQQKKGKSEEEKKKQAKIKTLGRCPMDFDWIRIDGGYRCAGGSHTITDAQLY